MCVCVCACTIFHLNITRKNWASRRLVKICLKWWIFTQQRLRLFSENVKQSELNTPAGLRWPAWLLLEDSICYSCSSRDVLDVPKPPFVIKDQRCEWNLELYFHLCWIGLQASCCVPVIQAPAFISGSIRAGKLPDLSRKVKNFLEEPALLSVFWVPEVTEMSSKVNITFFSLPFSYSVFCLIAHWKNFFIAFLLNQLVFRFSCIIRTYNCWLYQWWTKTALCDTDCNYCHPCNFQIEGLTSLINMAEGLSVLFSYPRAPSLQADSQDCF